MKVFLTGNYGYVGTVLENLLEKENFEIVGCDIGYFPKSLVNSQDYVDKKNYLKKDIRNVTSEDLEGVDAICHLAGLSNDPMGEINEELTYTINYKTTIELAKFIIWSLDKDITGIVHATNSLGISKYDLVKLINKTFDLNIDLLKNKDYEIDKTLLNTKIDNYNFPSYIKMIEKMKDWIGNNN